MPESALCTAAGFCHSAVVSGGAEDITKSERAIDAERARGKRLVVIDLSSSSLSLHTAFPPTFSRRPTPNAPLCCSPLHDLHWARLSLPGRGGTSTGAALSQNSRVVLHSRACVRARGVKGQRGERRSRSGGQGARRGGGAERDKRVAGPEQGEACVRRGGRQR